MEQIEKWDSYFHRDDVVNLVKRLDRAVLRVALSNVAKTFSSISLKTLGALLHLSARDVLFAVCTVCKDGQLKAFYEIENDLVVFPKDELCDDRETRVKLMKLTETMKEVRRAAVRSLRFAEEGEDELKRKQKELQFETELQKELNDLDEYME
ncbi:hypothetical protein ADUPG1_013327 [Aduncisulcus paluster]|uniref:PCI domain-containing protein n=1 Tax=Aduncisulcus paluster TaxID=2918883 RepID=A0ABQ5K2K9_9EUKA|nr:hypothetical protein ADUPG1_013327 [Aduncisulcus paluster]